MFVYIAFAIGAIVLIGYGIFYYKQVAGIKKIQDQVKYSYDSYSKTLTIYSQDPNFAKLLVSRRHQTKKYTDIPEKYIYTSASIFLTEYLLARL